LGLKHIVTGQDRPAGANSVRVCDFGGSNRGTIEAMFLAMIAMRVLEVMFFVGLVGSSVVVLISFVEDGKELFGKDE
jgi:hypothetical protein